MNQKATLTNRITTGTLISGPITPLFRICMEIGSYSVESTAEYEKKVTLPFHQTSY